MAKIITNLAGAHVKEKLSEGASREEQLRNEGNKRDSRKKSIFFREGREIENHVGKVQNFF